MLGTWELYLVAFAFAAVLVISWLLVALTGRRIRVTRVLIPERPVAGDEPEYIVTVKNASLLPGPQLRLRTDTEGLTGDDLEGEVESLGPRGQRIMRTRMGKVVRGVHTLPVPEAVAEDPLGVATATHRVGEPMTVTVYPRIAFLDRACSIPNWVSGRTGRASRACPLRRLRVPGHPAPPAGRAAQPHRLEEHGQDRDTHAPRDGGAGRRRHHPAARRHRRTWWSAIRPTPTSSWRCGPRAASPTTPCAWAAASA